MLCQGAELITANYMFCTFAILAAAPEDRATEITATVINWTVIWFLNLAGAVLHFVVRSRVRNLLGERLLGKRRAEAERHRRVQV